MSLATRHAAGTILTLVPGDLRRADVKSRDVATCDECGRSWDDEQSTGVTPVPAGRCPFEADHEDATPSLDPRDVALDAIFHEWAAPQDDTVALRRIADILVTTGREG